MNIPEFKDIQQAHRRIKGYIHRTPVLTSSSIDNILGASFFFKCENFQEVGTFKFRGALNSVLELSEEDAREGVGTHSSGNHAAALSLAAKIRGVQAFIVMPRTAPEIKKKAVKGYGGQITFCEPTLKSRETTMEKVIEKTGATFIPSYNYFHVIAGQGTAAKELMEEVPGLDLVMVPVGGGGLASGTAISVKSMSPNTVVIAAEPKGADDAYRSFKAGKIFPSENPRTIADGLLTSLGELTFAIIRDKVDDIVTVSDEAIIQAMRMVWERMKIIIEPSAAVTLAAFFENKVKADGQKIGIIFSGGNVDLSRLPFT